MSLSRRKFLTAAAAGLSVLGGGGLLYSSRLEPYWIEITQLSLTLPRLDRAFDGYRLMQISDIHLDGRFMDREHLLESIALARTQQVDAIVLTGDYVTDHINDDVVRILVEAFSGLSAPDGIYAVMGNHDYWTDANAVRRALASGGVIELSNRVHTICRGSAALHICGVDDIWERHHRFDQLLAQLPEEGAAILLAHEPDYADTSSAVGRFDLQLSGHSHGGQINIPLVGPLVLPWLGRKYHTGLYQVGTMFQYTNRGLGALQADFNFPAMRFNCRPEISLITLNAP